MPLPSRRTLLRWFHELEDDPARVRALINGWELLQAATREGIVAADEHDALARLALEMGEENLIGFDHPARGMQQFGYGGSSELQQATDFRSTAKGRQWLAERPMAKLADGKVGPLWLKATPGPS
jgi:hypothetical protein